MYNAYKKRQRDNLFSFEDYEKQKAKQPGEFYRDANYIEYGQQADVPKEKVNAMVNELDKLFDRRETFSRRREFFEDADVDFINDRNRVFNKKLGRAYNQYTAEIKQNLERGTA